MRYAITENEIEEIAWAIIIILKNTSFGQK